MTKTKEEQLVEASYMSNPIHFVQALNNDPDVNKAFDNNEPLLHFLVRFNQIELAKLLLEHQPKNPSFQRYDVNIKDKFYVPALIFAAINQETEMVELLINCGANVNASDSLGYTALHATTQLNNLSLTQLLLQNNADPNAVWQDDIENNYKNVTPLHFASMYRNVEMISLLVKYGADSAMKMNAENIGKSVSAVEIFVSDSNQNPDHNIDNFRKAVEGGLALRAHLLSAKTNKRPPVEDSLKIEKLYRPHSSRVESGSNNPIESHLHTERLHSKKIVKGERKYHLHNKMHKSEKRVDRLKQSSSEKGIYL